MSAIELQQSLPFTVLKRCKAQTAGVEFIGCNSPYRLRY